MKAPKPRKIETIFNTTFDETTHLERVLDHYRHAQTSHPYFADILAFYETKSCAESMLSEFREQLKREIADGECYAETVMLCELWEAFAAIAEDDKAAAVHELFDAVAVLLRMVDVLEGRQKLGKPKTKGGAK